MAKKGNLSKPKGEIFIKSNDGNQKPYTLAAENAISGNGKGFYFSKEQIKKLGELMTTFPADGLWVVIGKPKESLKTDSSENIEIIPVNINSSSKISIYEGPEFRGEISLLLGGLCSITNDGVNQSPGTEGVSQRTPPPFPR